MVIELGEKEKYDCLLEDLNSIIVQRIKNSRIELILAYGEMGERIFNDELYQKYGKGNQGFIRTLAKDSGRSYSTIQRAIQFYEKYQIVSPTSESWMVFEEGENISWHKIKTKYLPSVPKEPKSLCRHCPEHCPI